MSSAEHFDSIASDWDSQLRRIALMKAIGEAVLGEIARPDDRDISACDVLDYGCGTGLVGLFLHAHVRSVTGADNSPGMLAELRKKIAAGGLSNVRAMQLDLEQEPVPNERFDVIVVGMALHHIADTQKVLEAFYLLLRPGGTLFLADLVTEPGTFHGPEMDDVVHHHGFDRIALAQQLAGIGSLGTQSQTVFTIQKPVEGQGEQEFPVFLLQARK